MAAFRTLELLPSIFRTEANSKFLNATLDQLVAEPELERINGYIGRRFSNSFRPESSFIQEPSESRQKYQLEPSVVIEQNSTVEFNTGYQDFINKLRYLGGVVDNHSRLFENEYYSFDGMIDFDKFVNFNQYFWIPLGPDPVAVELEAGENIDSDILGSANYITANDVEFTNGLRVEFDNTVTPASYRNTQYYIEGVGSSIQLVPVAELVTPETYATEYLTTPDYITINRASSDRNAWSRANRWFHIDVINKTAEYNGTVVTLDQTGRALRPILEFQANIQLFDHGTRALAPVDLIDFTVTDVFSDLENQTGKFIDGVSLADGMRIIFAAESDILVRDKIYEVSFIDPDGSGTPRLHFSLTSDPVPVLGNSVLISQGIQNTGKVYRYTSTGWQLAQQKTKLQQPPKFDVFDSSDVSFSDPVKYPNNTFLGTEIFSYQLGTGKADPVLGFALKYRNINNIGDIVFDNDFDQDRFVYIRDNETLEVKVNTGTLHISTGIDTFENKNIWQRVQGNSFQYQIISYDVSGTSYRVDVEPLNPLLDLDLRVYLDSKKLAPTEYTFVANGRLSSLEFSQETLADKSRLDILIRSSDVSELGFYEIPANLEFNARNQEFSSLTLGQMRGHVQKIFDNISEIQGVFPGSSALRDFPVAKTTAGTILQHSAGLPYAMLFLVNDQLDFVSAVQQSRFDYSKFKYKFLDLAASNSDIDVTDPVSSVDEILRIINDVKTPDFPYYFSDMVPYGEKIRINSEIFFLNQRQFVLPENFDLETSSFRAVLVYLNGTQLLETQDYVFAPGSNTLILNDSVSVSIGDILSIDYYASTLGCWVPATPSKLGLWPRFKPEIFLDDTLLEPVNVIRGHDGSLMPVFGDFRDQLLLELEKRIYNNIKAKHDLDRTNLYDVVPGRSRDTGYDLDEVNQILSGEFFKWAGANRLNYSANTSYDRTNAFTYNYARSSDKLDSSILPGSWRAVYDYYFDTQRPHTHPWEMLGFSDKPDWWESEYGATPYTSSNTALWTDLSLGVIAQGPRAGVDSRFARAHLPSMIPVDSAGDLLPPSAFIVSVNTPTNADISWAVGHQGPAETAWRRSSEYPYAVQILLALAKPARYFGENLDREKYNKNNQLNQFLFSQTNQRITPRDIELTGINATGEAVSQTSYINWILDLIQTRSQQPSETLNRALKNFDIRLSYKMAAYTDKKYLRVFAEQVSPTSTSDSIVVPDEDYVVSLEKSAPITRVRYSGVIVTKTATGYRVDGLDLNRPFFTIVPSLVNNNNYAVTVLKSTGVVYRDYQRVLVNVPYGYEFATRQQIFDFLISYGRFLNSQGFVFRDLLEGFTDSRNWVLSGKEFLFWSQQGWPENSMIFLSPVGTRLRLRTAGATVDEIHDTQFSSRVLDQNLRVVSRENYVVNRQDSDFTLETTENQIIGFAEFDVIQFEHALIFKNTTMFNDIIYVPELGSRQARLKLVGFRTGNWNGTLAPAGFVLNQDIVAEWEPGRDYVRGALVRFKNQYYTANQALPASDRFEFQNWKIQDYNRIKKGLVINFANSAENFTSFYDVNGINLENQYDLLGKGLIGYRSRKYFADLGIDDTSQVKFYQGFIREKGSPRSFEALVGAEFDNASSDIQTAEEWAIRVGEYGALDSRQILELILNQSRFTANPATLSLISQAEPYPAAVAGYRPADLYRKSTSYSPEVFLNLENSQTPEFEIKTAGYLQLSDVDFTLFDLADYATLDADFSELGVGKTVWVARDFASDWDVFRVSETGANIQKIINRFDQAIEIVTDQDHGLAESDIIVIRNFTSGLVFNGIHQVAEVLSAREFIVRVPPELSLDDFLETEPAGILLRMQSLRFTNSADISENTPLGGWKAGDRFFVDQYGDNNHWAVYEKNAPWNNTYNFTDNLPNTTRGSALAINDQAQYALVGSAEYQTGELIILGTNPQNFLRQRSRFLLDANNVLEFGASLDLAQTTGVAGAPGSASNRGYVVVLDVAGFGFSQVRQVFTTPDAVSSGRFGSAVTISSDTRWIYVSAPEVNRVYAYKRTEVPSALRTTANITGDGSTLTFALGFQPISSLSVTVKNIFGKVYVQGIDFDISMGNITFTSAPDPDEQIVVAQQSWYYEFVNVITASDSNVGDKFGFSLSTSADGSRLVVGAPYHEYAEPPADSTQLEDAGVVYAFDRKIEAFFGGSETYQAINSLTAGVSVRVNDRFLIPGTEFSVNTIANTVTLIPSTAGFDRVYLEIDNFSLLNKFKSTSPERFNNFGYSVALCRTDCSIYVGSPSTDVESTNSGSVYRYVNTAKTYGSIAGSVANPVLTVGDRFSLDDFLIEVTAPDVGALVSVINNKQLPGISARTDAGKIVIESISDDKYNKLKIAQVSGTVLTDLGIEIYSLAQILENPVPGKNQYFGEVLAVSPDSAKLAVGSPSATSRFEIKFDSGNTTFDVNSTVISETTINSGSVQIFEYIADQLETVSNPGKLAFAQSLTSSTLTASDRFGQGLAVSDSVILVGAPGDSSVFENQGLVNVFQNSTGKNSFEISRQREPRVDADSINRIFIYNRKTNQILTALDFIDPVKGKILGPAAENLDYITEYDPARYNQTSFGTTTTVPAQAWGPAQVGKFWWNLSGMRFLDYEQDSLEYRAANWGKIFPGSQVEVYEWIASNSLPGDYQATGGSGVPLATDNSAYSEEDYLDPATGARSVRYYYWVKNRNTLSGTVKKTRTSAQVAELIENPQAQGVQYAAILKNSAVSLYNITGFLSATDSVLHVDYDVKINDDNLHTEYELIKTGATQDRPNKRVLDKFQDSLAGINVLGQAVPDTALSAPEQLGILSRPRQTVFLNRINALKQFVREVNKIFLREKISEEFDLSTLNSFEPIPRSGLGLWDESVANLEEFSQINFDLKPLGYSVLVEFNEDLDGRWCIFVKRSTSQVIISRVQAYDVRRYWEKIDWYAAGYSVSTVPDFVVPNRTELVSLAVTENSIVKMLDNGNSQFLLLRATETGTNVEYETVGIQRGTIQLLKTLYENPTTGYDSASFEAGLFDESLPQIEVRLIFQALSSDILVGRLNVEFNNLFFGLLKYAVAEQNNLDWAFKTSFVSVVHNIRQLAEYPIFRRDNQQFVLDYLSEAKPYRTKIREYVLSYDREDISNTAVTDFDARDADTQVAWQNNYENFILDSIDVITLGSGYSDSPVVTITGGGGAGATATATVEAGSIVSITVTNPGTGYETRPSVTITDVSGTNATARAQLRNSLVRNVKTTLKFDRVNYAWDLTVQDWQPNTVYAENDIITYQGQAYSVQTAFTSGNTFSIANLETYAAENFDNAVDRTWAFYHPKQGQTPRDLTALFRGLEYPGVFVNAPAFTVSGGFDVRPWDRDSFDSILSDSDAIAESVLDDRIQSSFTDTQLGLRPTDVILDGAAFVDTFNSHAPEELIPGQCFDTLDFQVYTTENTDISAPPIAFRIFRNMMGETQYLRISAARNTVLAADLNINDTEISVVDASVLAEPDPEPALSSLPSVPGVVFINGERITYFVRNLAENKLVQIRRGTHGTGAPVLHAAGSVVTEANEVQIIDNADGVVWYNIVPGGQLSPDGSTLEVLTTGSGLQGSSTTQANFLLAEAGPEIS
jgi:hypothetical protein